MLKLLDRYIIKKFLGTFFLSIVLIISIAVVFDITEKLDDFMENHAPLKAIVFDYYMNFIPYYVNMFIPLFIFISVIFFTSKMAENSEVIAIFASGVKYSRFVWPYMISAAIIASITVVLSSFVIPPATKNMLEFQEVYVKKRKKESATKIQMKVSDNEILFIDYYDQRTQAGRRASIDVFDGKTLKSRTTAMDIYWMGGDQWRLSNYVKREFDGLYEHVTTGSHMITRMNILPKDFFVFKYMQQQLTTPELAHYIERQNARGVGFIKDFEIEYAKRFSSPFAAFVLTIIGVSLSYKKIKGGMGLNLGLGILLCIIYILFESVSSTFAVNGVFPPVLAVWLPNIVFSFIAIALYRKARLYK